MSIDILKDDIKNKKIRNVYLFYGPEEYLKKYYMDSMESLLLTEDLKALNRIVMEGRVDEGKIIEACETMPVFCEKKVVLVKNSGLLKSKKKSSDEEGTGKGKGKGKNEDLQTYIQNIPEYTCLIFYEDEIDKRAKLCDVIKKSGLIVEFALQKPAELAKWVIKVFKSYKKDIDMLTASQLVEYSEQGMTEILNEVSKLVLYLGARSNVTGRDVEAICTKSIKGRIFDLTDAIAEKKGIKALQLLNDMLILKEPMPRILFMITRQFRHILEMKLLNGMGLSTNEAASRMGITPYAAGKVFKQTGSFTVEKLKEALSDSLELDIAIKTGKLNDRVAVELFITKFCSS